MERNSGTVLIVDDDASVRRFAARILDRQGYRVLEAEDGDGAMVAAGDGIDLLLADIVLPRVNGVELATRLRASSPTLRVVYMSGYGEDELERMGLNTVGAAYISKPFSAQVLTLMVHGALAE